MEISRRKFLKLAGTASLTAIFGLSLTGCVEDDNNITKEEDNSKDYEPLADNKKYFEAKEHHFYIEVSTETNGETSYYEENVSQTSNLFLLKEGALVANESVVEVAVATTEIIKVITIIILIDIMVVLTLVYRTILLEA